MFKRIKESIGNMFSNFFTMITSGISNYFGTKIDSVKNFILNKIYQNKFLLISILISIILFFYFTRAFFYENVNNLRIHSPEIISIIFLTLVFISALRFLKNSESKMKNSFFYFSMIVSILGIVFVMSSFNINKENNPFEYLNKSITFKQIEVKELEYLPLSTKDRIYPYQTILNIAKDKITSSEYTVENFELIYDIKKDTLQWNAEKSPLGKTNKLVKNVDGIVTINASSDQIEKNEYNTNFHYGRKLTWFNSLDYILPKHLNIFDYFDKTLDDNVKLIQMENGEWVQVVAVINWDGIWPAVYPKFHGVYVIHEINEKYGSVNFLNTDFKVPVSNPEIEFLTPEDIKKTSYLQNQNLVPEEITNHYVSSWNFKNGIMNYLFTKKDLTKVTAIEEELNKQPFTIWFDDVKSIDNNETTNGIFQFYALEPMGTNKGLSNILLFDTHGYNEKVIVYNYDFSKKKLSLLGPQRISETIKDSDKHIDWSSFIIAESKPFIKIVNNERKFFYINSVISKKSASAKPTIVIADPDKLNVKWFNGNNIDKQIEKYLEKK